ncbi:unnamed protein product, partial [Protopolystoma xenopodis]
MDKLLYFPFKPAHQKSSITKLANLLSLEEILYLNPTHSVQVTPNPISSTSELSI